MHADAGSELHSMKLLVVSEWFPYPPVAGAKIRAYNLIRQLARLADVDLVAQINTLSAEQVAAGTKHLHQFCNSVESVPAVPYSRDLGKALRLLVDPLPATIRHKRNLALEQLLAARLSTRYDAVIATISGAPSSTLHSLIQLGARPLIADSLELGVLRPDSAASPARWMRSEFIWRHLRRYTHRMCKEVDVVTVTSDIEQGLFADLVCAPDQCVVVPNVLDLEEYVGDFGPRDPRSLLYAGSFGYFANYEAMLWFTQRVFGRIAGRESLKVCVTGNPADRDLTPLRQACPQIEFAGFVDDIRPYFARSGICVVPILSGGSTRLKIIEAMAWGTPVVSTRVGAEGLAVTHGQDILLADTPDEFAAMIDQLINDQALWQRLSTAGRELVAQRYSADSMYRQYRDILSLSASGRAELLKGNA
jgi:glycosyltransferase involved in cell wall biosynthesis